MNKANSILNSSNNQPLRVFLVEDALDIRDLIVENISMIPGVVVAGVAESEGDALDQLNTLPCDILIVDIQLKKGNGISLLRHIAEGGKVFNMLKIICSNNASEVFRRAGQQYGARHFFDKTSEFPQLFDLLKELGATEQNSTTYKH